MVLPATKFNTFFKEHYERNPSIDFVSKIYIIMGVFFGLNRIPVLGHSIVFTVLATVYSLLIGCVNVYGIFGTNSGYMSVTTTITMIMAIFLHYIKIVIAFAFCYQVKRVFKSLDKLDDMTDCTPKLTSGTIMSSLKYCILECVMYCCVALSNVIETKCLSTELLMIHHILDLNFFSNFFIHLIKRIRLVNYYLESSIEKKSMGKRVVLKEFKFKSKSGAVREVGVGGLMDIYTVIVEAHELTIKAIEWQVLIILVTVFGFLLWLTYFSVLSIISGNAIWLDILKEFLISFALVTPLFTTCLSADDLQAEVRILKKLLAARLFEDNLNKHDRSIARAFLALTDTKDLSFNLFHMIPINISLPFAYVGLLLTYLIILLQFQKVIGT